jgi:hypothetical protein
MIPKNKLTELAADWLNAWNAKDINRLMKHYHDDIVLCSPTIVTRWDNDVGVLNGIRAVRKHFEKGFEDRNHIPFELLGLLTGVDGIVLVYRKGAFGMAADVITLDQGGKATRVDRYNTQ